MALQSDVELAYRFFLGREPESADAVRNLAEQYGTFAELRRAFIGSDEFKAQLGSAAVAALRPLSWPRNDVDVDVSAENLAKMLNRVEKCWEDLGNSEPFWSVLTHDKFLSANVEENRDAFYQTGKFGVDLFKWAAGRAGITDFSAFPTCLEFGCGVGRLTVWLADLFKTVIGCDISQPHLDAARATIDKRGLPNVRLARVETVDTLSQLPSFDVFFSLIVLQHNPPPVAAYILSRILEKLNPGGLAYFQIPTYRLGYRFDAARYVDSAGDSAMEMHVVPQKDLFALFKRHGCTVLEIREDDWTGDPQFVSNTFLLRK